MDPHTLHITDALVNLTCSLTVAVLWLQRQSETCFAFWSVSFATFGGALLLKGAVYLHPLLGALYFGGLALGIKLMLAGFRNFDGDNGHILRAAPFVLAPALTFLAIAAIRPSTQEAEFAAFVLCCLVGIRLIGYVLVGGAGKSTYRRIAGITLAAQLTLTLALVLSGDRFVSADSLDIAIPFADQIGTIVLATCLFGMSVERHQRAMEDMAYRDALTGALNRMGFLKRMTESAGPSGLLVMDLDHFKKTNDRYGHLGGDAVLREFARRVSGCLPEEALFARMGGEEFVVLLPGADHVRLTAAAQGIRTAVRREPVRWNAGAIGMTVSIGLAMLRSGEAFDAAMARGDAALYRAKTDGRDRIAV